MNMVCTTGEHAHEAHKNILHERRTRDSYSCVDGIAEGLRPIPSTRLVVVVFAERTEPNTAVLVGGAYVT